MLRAIGCAILAGSLSCGAAARPGDVEPRAAGVRALLANVDRMLPMHNLDSLADLGRALRRAA